MTWSKSIRRCAPVDVDELAAHLYLSEPHDPEEPRDLRCRVAIECGTDVETGDVSVAAVLSADELDGFHAALAKLRRAGMQAAGYEEDGDR